MLVKAWETVERTVVGLLGGIALLLSAFEILTRYFLPQYAPDWGEEVIVYVTVWGVFLAGSALVAENRHVRADLLVRLLGPSGQRVAELGNAVAGLIFTAAMTWFGWEVVAFAVDMEETSISSLKFPIAWYYACLPVGMALMCVRYAIRLWILGFRFDPDKHTIQAGEFPHD